MTGSEQFVTYEFDSSNFFGDVLLAIVDSTVITVVLRKSNNLFVICCSQVNLIIRLLLSLLWWPKVILLSGGHFISIKTLQYWSLNKKPTMFSPCRGRSWRPRWWARTRAWRRSSRWWCWGRGRTWRRVSQLCRRDHTCGRCTWWFCSEKFKVE